MYAVAPKSQAGGSGVLDVVLTDPTNPAPGLAWILESIEVEPLPLATRVGGFNRLTVRERDPVFGATLSVKLPWGQIARFAPTVLE